MNPLYTKKKEPQQFLISFMCTWSVNWISSLYSDLQHDTIFAACIQTAYEKKTNNIVPFIEKAPFS